VALPSPFVAVTAIRTTLPRYAAVTVKRVLTAAGMVVQCTPSVEYCHAYVKIGVGLAVHVPTPAEMRGCLS
jgi:hypothetical protein